MAERGSAAAPAAAGDVTHDPVDTMPAAAAPAGEEEEWAARKLQALERGRQARKFDVASVSRQARLVKTASMKFKRLKPLDGALVDGGFPGAPVNPSMALALQMEEPADATCYERSRDAVLRWFVHHQQLFMTIAIAIVLIFVIDILVIIVFFWGAIFGVGIIGRNDACDLNRSDPTVLVTSEETITYPPMTCVAFAADGTCLRSEYVATFCNLNQYMFNICVKVIMILLTYINVLPIPWRVSIGVDAWGDACTKRGSEEPPGVDFYGRPTEALWFHIPRHRRALIALLLNLSYVGHIMSVVTAIIYFEYIETQTWPGVFAINLPALTSIITIISAGVLQGNAEARLIAEQPERFPPPMLKYVKEGYREWRSGKSKLGLIATIKQHLKNFDEAVEALGGRTTSTMALTSIAVCNDPASGALVEVSDPKRPPVAKVKTGKVHPLSAVEAGASVTGARSGD